MNRFSTKFSIIFLMIAQDHLIFDTRFDFMIILSFVFTNMEEKIIFFTEAKTSASVLRIEIVNRSTLSFNSTLNFLCYPKVGSHQYVRFIIDKAEHIQEIPNSLKLE